MTLFRTATPAMIVAAALLATLAGCDLPHGNLPMPQMGGMGNGIPSMGSDSPFNNKNYADPHPHSDSDDQQRAAYIQHQKEQSEEQSRSNAMPDLSSMSCSRSGSSAQTANAGMMSSSVSCHN